ncbi:protein GOS9 isoform X2 [Sorghum bicolor]|uniref:protein GOS9 isoform X2 n=1 Tax=Sorghum bicolor TaxID=4558 RepID=UPI000B4249BC|nr:protein GOS9 isoform X2 [Sorghum bicolor]|eukprot:XP_021313425.1 protein GOS9 isoform X2 [Sorghum bicolor]
MSSVVKLGTWGGDGGSACDLTVAPQRLESITVRWGKVIDWISFSYRDRSGELHTAGPWGGNGKGEGTETISLEPSEYVTGVAWSVGPFTFKNVECCITSIKVMSNLRSYGPFGHGVDSTHHSLPVLDGSAVGMFARAGDFLDAIGFYILPAAVKPTDPNNQEVKEKDSSHEGKENGKS